MLLLIGTVLAVGLATPADARPRDPNSASAPLEYVSPLPGSRYHLPEANIIIRPGGAIDPRSSLDDRLVTVHGSRSGDHSGRLDVSDDGETLIFDPFDPFWPGEEVSWHLGPGLRTVHRGPIRPIHFTFSIAGGEGNALRSAASISLDDELGIQFQGGQPVLNPEPPSGALAPRSGASGSDLPGLHPIASGPHSPGYLFLCDFNLTDTGYKSHLMIVDDKGTPIFVRELPGRALDFKVQPNGWLTYHDLSVGYFYALDSQYAVIDSFRCGDGYSTDLHELQLLPDGHALLMSYDPRIVDMSLIVAGGRKNALVTGLIIQELDREKRVVFLWRSWDHYQITDATHRDFTAARIDFAHGNAIERDFDGDLLISSRHMDEITKISRRTGEIVWRLGGKNNQFTFVNDPIGFSHQHDVRRIENGNLTLFDNGFFHTPPFSRAVEYRLDEGRRTATLVWEYRPDPPLIGFALGSVQRLESGNTVIGWGSVVGTTVTEVTPTGEIVAGLALDPPLVSYRSFRFDWPPVQKASVAIEPDVINSSSRASWLNVTIVGESFDAWEIDVASVRLAGTGPADAASVRRDADGSGGKHRLHLRFDRGQLLAVLSPGSHRLDVSGSLSTGGGFRGYADVRVMDPNEPRSRPRRVELVSGAGALPVQVRIGDGASRYHKLSVYDTRGRLVRRWTAPADEEGQLSWDGSRSDGAASASGVYFIRVEGSSAPATLKVVIAR